MNATKRGDDVNSDAKSISRASDDAIVRDAARYRWLRRRIGHWYVSPEDANANPEYVDARIDAELASEARASTSRSSTDADGISAGNVDALK